ncbi:MAG: hypothetical protein KTR31_09010 [Myxococcales bacterium]|nr:hypothetical protein [Myxococcales bacterium]
MSWSWMWLGLLGCDSPSDPSPTVPSDTRVAPDTDVVDSSPTTTADTSTPTAPSTVFLGILGASDSDEYSADDNRGGAYAKTTSNWAELLVSLRDVDLGPWGEREEPRRSGYERNWARSGARIQTLISTGQHTGLAEQVSRGEVAIAVMRIGNNDFSAANGQYQDIYSGAVDDVALEERLANLSAGLELIVETVLTAGDVKMLVTTIGDPASPGDEDLVRPEFLAAFPDADGRARVSAAIAEVNASLRALETDYPGRVGVADTAVAVRAIGDAMDDEGQLLVGTETIDVFSVGGEPHNGLLDATGHLGTVLSGLFANELVVGPLEEHFGVVVPLLTDEEILKSAGLP